MDKETLSNYGWIVICVLVLAVLLALATPFGIFVSDAVKTTTQGLFDVNQTALNSTNLVKMESQSFPNDNSTSANETTYYTAEEIEADEHLYAIGKTKPEYVVAKFNDDYSEVVITKNGDDSDGQIMQYAPWGTQSPMVQHKNTLETAIIKEGITQMNGIGGSSAFVGCTKLLSVTLPTTLTYLGHHAFYKCSSLKVAPVIPINITDMPSSFAECTSLTNAPSIPNGVNDMSGTFHFCTSLTIAPSIPDSVTNMDTTFTGCSSLVSAPIIPNSINSMCATFQSCTTLKTVPTISNNTTDMSWAFDNCMSLTTIPAIPSSVINMYHTFSNCTSLTGTIEINANPTDYNDCFLGVDFEAQKITLTGTSSILDEIGKTGTNYCTTCNGYCKGSH